jgi:hypothetical protein
MMGGMAGPSNPMLTPQEQAADQQRRRMAIAGTLLQASGPRPQGTSSPLGAFGEAMQAGTQAGDQFADQALKMRMIAAQLQPKAEETWSPVSKAEKATLGIPEDSFAQRGSISGQIRIDDRPQPTTTISLGDKLNEPIPIAQLDTVRLPDGKTPPIGTTYAEARAMGAQVLSAADQTRTQQADQALGILNQLEALAVGPEGVFNQVMPGIANRAASAIEFGFDMLEQKDPRASRFADMSRATLAPFIKFLGESGALAQGDVDRALGLVPRIFPLPDTGEVARDKIGALREIITRGVRNMNSVTRQSENVPPPPAGFTLDPE